MRRHIIRALLTAVAAGGALLAAGLAGSAAGAATAGPHTRAYPVINTPNQGGYTASGRWFRFAATTVKVPGASPYAQYAAVVLGGVGVSPVTVAIKPGGGQASVGWADGGQPFGREGGTMTGPWTTSQVVDTTNGGSSGQTVMSPSVLFNNGANFGAWLR